MKRGFGVFLVLGAALGSFGCSSSSGDAPGGSTSSSPPPPPASGGPACFVSADCPAGTHCDLGECIQDCNVTDPCIDQLTCSPRGRCLTAGQQDTDPPPVTTHAGDVTIDPPIVTLTETDTACAFTLKSTAAGPIRYRIESSAAHLSTDAPRGSVNGTATISLRVDPSKVTSASDPGSVTIHTELGEVIAHCPLHRGLTGSYAGVMHYDGGAVNLGDARVAIDLLESGGDVQLRVDSGKSLLFPKVNGAETTGHGLYTVSDGLHATLTQVIDGSFGGARNHFARPVGRTIALSLKRDRGATLSGTFQESIYGEAAEALTMSGSIVLQYHPGPDPKFTAGAPAAMPAAPVVNNGEVLNALDGSAQAIFGWSEPWLQVGCGYVYGCGEADLSAIEQRYASPLEQNFAALPSYSDQSDPVPTIAKACGAAMHATSVPSDYSGNNYPCGLLAPIAESLVARTVLGHGDRANAQNFGRAVQRTAQPAILLAKQKIVEALDDSLATGLTGERQDYDAAASTLAPVATWLSQPVVLDFLRNTSTVDAAGPAAAPGDPNPADATYPAARALAELFATEVTIDGERARLNAANGAANPSQLAQQTQERALLSYLQGVSVVGLLQTWGKVPPSVGARMIGFLSPLNQGFSAFLQGANVLGVGQGFVPFVYREGAGMPPTLYEQMQQIADESVANEQSTEQEFQGEKRAYDTQQGEVNAEILKLQNQYDGQLEALCGVTRDEAAMLDESNYLDRCTKGRGSIGVQMLAISQAMDALRAAQGRIKSQEKKIHIDEDTLKQTQMLQDDEIQFIKDTGDQLDQQILTEGIITAEEKAVEVASHADLWNGGAPLGEAVVEGALEMTRTGVEQQKQDLATAAQMHAASTNKDIAYVQGMAEIQKEWIDFAQMGVDISQQAVEVEMTELEETNALDLVRNLIEERARALALVNSSPTMDPSFRILRDHAALGVLAKRATAQTQLDLAAHALEYEVNMSIAGADGAVLSARNASGLKSLSACLRQIFNESRLAYGSPQQYTTTISVRQMLGIRGPRKDDVTGQTMSEGEQFRQMLLKNENIDGDGGVGIKFATDLQPGNGLWAADVCNDRIASVQAQLVGDFLGDNQARIDLDLSGSAVMRSCETGAMESWSLGATATSGGEEAPAAIAAGVNTFGDSAPNSSLFGQSVARAAWRLVIPSAVNAPENADVDLKHVDDIVLRFVHTALPRRATPATIDVSCLNGIGG